MMKRTPIVKTKQSDDEESEEEPMETTVSDVEDLDEEFEAADGEVKEEGSDDEGADDLFWCVTIPSTSAAEVMVEPTFPYFVRITSASFGPKVKQGSRTCVMLQTAALFADDKEPVPLCVLKEGQKDSQPLDLIVSREVMLTLEGDNVSEVTLSGYKIPFEKHLTGMDDEDMGEESFDELDDEELAKLDEETKAALMKARKRNLAEMEEDDEEAPELMEEAVEPPSKKQKLATKEAKPTQAEPKQQKKKKQKKKKAEAAEEAALATSPKQSPGKKEKGKKWVEGPKGLKYKILKPGTGKAVKKGSKVTAYYVGQLDDKSIFDKHITGEGFKFEVGKKQVIEGWDMGFKGMKVGEKRRLQIPSQLAYGKKGSPPEVPGNATLTFTVEVKDIQ